MKPKLILFDLFGTLVFPTYKIKKENFFVFYQKIGIRLKTKEDIEKFTSVFTQLMAESENWLDLSKKLLEKFLPTASQETINKLANFYQENLVYQLFEDAKEIINIPYQKAILTNAAFFLFSHLGLEKHFQIFTPRETKFIKPDKRAFLFPLEKLGVKSKETLMIGDEIEKDLLPAKNLGMEVILIDRQSKIENPPVRKISSLRELKNFLI